MKDKVRFSGMDVHAETIGVAVAKPDGEVRSLGVIIDMPVEYKPFVQYLGGHS